ncbi:MAG: hypothetical protein JRI59_07545, partial [Deltaproteobacteria bacterium]|nr:hypothetical protein [Deltaproteobacteria bacterium]
MTVPELVQALTDAGFRLRVHGTRLVVRFTGKRPVSRTALARLLEAIKARKPEVLTYLKESG